MARRRSRDIGASSSIWRARGSSSRRASCSSNFTTSATRTSFPTAGSSASTPTCRSHPSLSRRSLGDLMRSRCWPRSSRRCLRCRCWRRGGCSWASGRFPPAPYADESLYDRLNSVAQLQAATTVIPSDAPVNADAGLTVWLANRHTINDFPDMLDGSSYVVIDQNTFLGATTSKAKRQQALDGLAAGGRRLLYDDGRFQIWSPVGDWCVISR